MNSLKSCLFFWILAGSCFAKGGKFVNPMTDICWKCIFPIHISGINITPSHGEIASYQKQPLCSCAGFPPKLGIPLAFWEPTILIDVTRTPYKLSAWGGISIGNEALKRRGGLSHVGESGRTSFYNVHYYNAPILHWLNLIDFPCLESSEMTPLYLSEFDPFWDDDEWSAVLYPEALLFANPLAQVACIADCTASSLGSPQNSLFWCAGCMGSYYPFIGHVSHHVGGIQASYLLVHRLLGKLHSLGMRSVFEEEEFCSKTFFPRLYKTAYKTQLVQPIANTEGPCHPLGKSDVFWGAGKTYPYGGEDFVYLIWTKNHCCLDAIQPTIKTFIPNVIPEELGR